MTTNFFSPLSFVAVFGSGIRDLGSRMGKIQDPGSRINILDPQHCLYPILPILQPMLLALPSSCPSCCRFSSPFSLSFWSCSLSFWSCSLSLWSCSLCCSFYHLPNFPVSYPAHPSANSLHPTAYPARSTIFLPFL